MANLSREEILNAIGNMSVFELVELTKDMEAKFGVSAAAVVPVASMGPAAAAAAPVEEKTEFTVVMTSFGANKIAVIKVVREETALGLKEAKDLAEAVPAQIKQNISKADAEALKKKLEAAGATVELK